MIKKIIASGQPGVEQAALEVAHELFIDYGGWIPLWRAEEGNQSLIRKYHLHIMSNGNYVRATEQNILDSDGVLILGQGEPTGHAALNRRLAQRNSHPWLYIDLDRIPRFEASNRIQEWISTNGIENLNVTGAKTSQTIDLYQTTIDILKAVFQLALIEPRQYEYNALPTTTTGTDLKLREFINLPRSVDEAVAVLLETLTFRERTRIANMVPGRLALLSPSLGLYVKNEFRLWKGNETLVQDCRAQALREDEEPSAVIIRALWERLQEDTNVLRIVK